MSNKAERGDALQEASEPQDNVLEVGINDISTLMGPVTERRQSLRGFDPEYADIVDYIVRCTHRIWEEKNVGLIYTHYRHNALTHSAYGLTYGRDDVVANTIQMQVAFPDRRIFADDVIWAGDDEVGFHTSHRITSVGRNTGWSQYGPPTGRRVRFGVIANCFVYENRIVEEWLVRDEMAMVRDLGLDVDEVVERLIVGGACPPYRRQNVAAVEQTHTVRGQGAPSPAPELGAGPFDPDAFVRHVWHGVWNERMFGKMYDYYAPRVICHTVGNRDLYGVEDVATGYQSLLAAFPDAGMNIDHIYWQGDEASGYRAAVRWTLTGTHLGYSVYGAPTRRRINIMGISQQHIRGGQVVQEWMLFNEIALLCQLRVPEAE